MKLKMIIAYIVTGILLLQGWGTSPTGAEDVLGDIDLEIFETETMLGISDTGGEEILSEYTFEDTLVETTESTGIPEISNTEDYEESLFSDYISEEDCLETERYDLGEGILLDSEPDFSEEETDEELWMKEDIFETEIEDVVTLPEGVYEEEILFEEIPEETEHLADEEDYLLDVQEAADAVLFADENPDVNISASGICGDNVTWSLNDQGTLKLEGSGLMDSYLNETLQPWAEYEDSIHSVIVQEGITSIGQCAFSNCENLTTVLLPESITTVEGCAFQYCTILSELDLPNSVETMGNWVFGYCTNLMEINLPERINSIGKYSFYGSGLQRINIPVSLRSVGEASFCSLTNGVMQSVFYQGTEDEWNAISFGDRNVQLTNAEVQYGKVSVTDLFFKASSVTVGINETKNLELQTIPSYASTGDVIWSSSNESVVVVSEDGAITGIQAGSVTILAANAPGSVTASCNVEVLETGSISDDEEFLVNGSCGDNLSWILDKNGLLTVSGTGSMTDYLTSALVPWHDYVSQINAISLPYGLLNIGKHAFCDCCKITSITIPDSVTSIGKAAFSNCSALENVNFPQKLETVGESSFHNCVNLSTLDLPDTVTSIEIYAFMECKSLQHVEVPSLVENLRGTFYGCSNLKTAILPEHLKSIGDYTFENCSLSEIIIPDSVTEIGRYAFYGNIFSGILLPERLQVISEGAFARCSGLIEIKIPNSVTRLEKNVFSNCRSLASVYLHDGITDIEEGAFSYCESLTSFTIPSSVKGIESSAFAYCKYLQNISMPSTVSVIATGAFKNCYRLEMVNFDGTQEQWSGIVIESDNDSLTNAEIVFSQESIFSGDCGQNLTWSLDTEGRLVIKGTGPMDDWSEENSIWKGNETIKSIEISSGVTSVGSYAFAGCSGITSVSIPDGMNAIGSYAFSNCSGLPAIEFPETVERIGEYAFFRCKSLKEVELPSRVTVISAGTFRECTGMSSVVIAGDITRIEGYAFCSCSSLTEITLPQTLNTIERYAFSACSGITDVYFGGSNAQWIAMDNRDRLYFAVYNIHYSSISEVTGVCGDALTWRLDSFGHLFIEGNGEMYDWERASSPWYALTDIVSLSVSGNVTSIGSYAFEYCINLETFTLPAGLLRIGDHAFYYCINLQEAQIPDRIKVLPKYLFYSCTNLCKVQLPEGLLLIDDYVFHSCYSLSAIDIPEGVNRIGLSAFQHNQVLTTVVIPDSVTTIARNAFGNSAPTIYCSTGSYAQSFAKESNLSVVTHDNGRHSVENWTVEKEASCTSAGMRKGNCGICGIEISEEIPVSEHTIVKDKAVAASCTENGLTEGSHCSECNTVFTPQTVVPATRHEIVTVGAVAATCTTAGKTKKEYCSACQMVIVESRTIPAKGHRAVTDPAIAATCTSAGKTAGTHCSVCGMVLSAQKTIAATGHSWSAFSVKKTSTVFEKGIQTRFCSKCGREEKKEIALLVPTYKTSTNSVVLYEGTSNNSFIVSDLAKGDSLIKWSSSNPKVAEVSSNGTITGVREGSAIVMATLRSGLRAFVRVKVLKKVVHANSIKGLKKRITMRVGKKITLKPRVYPAGSIDKVTFKTSNKKVVTVNGKGVMRAKKAGSAKITVKAGKAKFIITVKVKKKQKKRAAS